MVASAVNQAQFDRGVDFARLNGAERQVLGLLAEGHTAKSIASELDTSVAAVNERLREARRKTGVGSSRELARLLKAQEIRDEQIGVGSEGGAGPTPVASRAERRRYHRGVIAMTGLLFIAATAAALVTQAPAPANDVEPLLGAPMPRSPDLADFHAKVRTEARDPNWAPRIEARIRERVMQIPLIGKDGNVLRVTCATTICEVAGNILSSTSKRERDDPKSPVNVAVRDLQVAPLPDDLAKLGLKNEGGQFGGGQSKPERLAFFLYYSRIEPKPKS